MIVTGDLTRDYYDAALLAGSVAVDIETDGLDWRGRIGVISFALPDNTIQIVHRPNEMPHYIIQILENKDVVKLFHNAIFDIRFLMHSYGVQPETILCTRIAAKLADPKKDKYGSHSLKNILEKKLNVFIPKGEALSDWFTDELTDQQVAYCISDVIYLHDLVGSFKDEIDTARMQDTFFQSSNFASTYAFLQLMGYNARDLYEYD